MATISAGPVLPFAGPAVAVDAGAYGWAVAQGFVVFRYGRSLGPAGLQRLCAWIAGLGARRVVMAPATQSAQITASTA